MIVIRSSCPEPQLSPQTGSSEEPQASKMPTHPFGSWLTTGAILKVNPEEYFTAGTGPDTVFGGVDSGWRERHAVERKSDMRLSFDFPKSPSLRIKSPGVKSFAGVWLGCCLRGGHLGSSLPTPC